MLKVTFFFFFALTISIFSLSVLKKEALPEKRFQITAEERIWLREFFEDFLFDSPGSYTLFGSKPVSGACLYHHQLSDEEKKEMEAYLASMPDDRKRQRRHDFEENYMKWKGIKDRFNIRQYLFGEFISPIDAETTVILFVNIESAIKTIIASYEDFRRILGIDFDPVQVVFEAENKESPFWNAVMKSHVLMGILHGFGKENSWFFDWEIRHKDSDNKIGAFFKSLPSKVYEEKNIRHQTPDNFMLPIFGSYGLHPTDTALIEKYKEEYKVIKSLYKGQDEVDVALSWLTR